MLLPCSSIFLQLCLNITGKIIKEFDLQLTFNQYLLYLCTWRLFRGLQLEYILITLTPVQTSLTSRQTPVKMSSPISKAGEVLSLLIQKVAGRFFYSTHSKNLQDLTAHMEVGKLTNIAHEVVRMTLVVFFISPMCCSIGIIGHFAHQQSVTSRSKSLCGVASQWELCFSNSGSGKSILSCSKQKSALT